MSKWSEYMPECDFNICNLQVISIATNSKHEYKLSFPLEMISDFDNKLTKTCSCRNI